MDIRKQYFLFIALFIGAIQISLPAHSAVSQLKVNVEHKQFLINEWVTLEIIANDKAAASALDLSPLKQDFMYRSPSVSSQRSIMNGQSTRTTTWTTMIRAKRAGRLTIPQFKVDNVSSDLVNVLVMPLTSSQKSNQRSFIEITTDASKVYVQQQITYTVKLYTKEQIERGTLTPPTMENADIQEVGEYKRSSEIRDGQRFTVHTWSFAIIAQNNGDYTLTSPIFDGEMVDNSRQSFGMFRSTKPITVEGEETRIKVLPVPANIDYPWMPAEFVQLQETWSDANKSQVFMVGEPITRTLTLTTLGLREEQLTEIKTQYPPGMKVYADQPEVQSQLRDGRLIARRIQSEAVIPNKAGTFVLPEVQVPWFNIVTEKTEFATIQARTITVKPSATEPATQSALPATAPSVSNNEDTVACVVPSEANVDDGELAVSNSDSGNQSANRQESIELLILVGALIGLWLITLISWRLHVKRLSVSVKNIGSHQSETSVDLVSHQQLMVAVSNQVPSTILSHLKNYLNNIQGTKRQSLEECLSTENDAELTEAVRQLQATTYGKNKATLNWNNIKHVLSKLRKPTSSSRSATSLNPLYPEKS